MSTVVIFSVGTEFNVKPHSVDNMSGGFDYYHDDDDDDDHDEWHLARDNTECLSPARHCLGKVLSSQRCSTTGSDVILVLQVKKWKRQK